MTANGEHSAVLRVTTLPFDRLEPLALAGFSARLAARFAAEERLARELARLDDDLFALAGRPQDAGAAGAARRNAVLALRRDLFHRETAVGRERPDGLPPEIARRVADACAALARSAAEAEALEAEFASRLRDTERALVECVRAPRVREGLRLVGRSLLAKVERAAAVDPRAWRHADRHALTKAVAYLVRFTTKTSPHGVFCATGRARFAAGVAAVQGENRVRVEVRLGVGEARKVTATLAVDPMLEPVVPVRVNPTLRPRAAGGWTFWRAATPRNGDDSEVRTEVPDHPVLAAFLAAAEPGTLAAPELIAAAAARCGFDAAAPELLEFFRRLVRIGLLVAEAEIPWSSWRPLADLARRVRGTGVTPAWLAEIEEVEHAVDALADLEPAARVAALDPLVARCEALPHARPIARDQLVRTDAATALEVTLPDAVRDELAGFIAGYARFYSALYPAARFRAAHVRRFLARHAADTDVELLDLYHGVFEPEPPSRPILFPEPRGSAHSPEAEASRRAFCRFRDDLVSRARVAAGEDIELAGEDWSGLLRDAPPTPVFSCGLLFQIAASDPAAIAAGRWRAAINAIYPGGGLSVSRLASLHADDGWIAAELARGHRAMERDGAVLAEVSFMHAGRTANAGLRPALLAHEIVLPGDCATPGKIELPLADLVVRYDSASSEFVLRSKRLDRRVRPIVSSGISVEGFFSFLVEIGRQGFQPLAYFPGFDAEDLPVWPRVRCGNVVLFRRRWHFAADELPRVPNGIDFTAFTAVARWRADHDLPRRVFVHTTAEPKPFFVDLESPLLLAPMLHATRVAGGAVSVTEMLPGPDELWVRDDAGRYASEFLVHFAHPGSTRGATSATLVTEAAR